MKKYLQQELCVPLPDVYEADNLLFHAVMEKSSPSSVVNALYGLIHRPIIAFDTSFRLIAFAFPRPFSFAPWEEIASTESLSDTYIYENNALFYQEKMYNLRRSSFFNTDVSVDFPQVDGPIISNGKLIGYVGVCVASDDEVDEITYINDRLAEALAILVPRYKTDAHTSESENIWEHFLSQDTIDSREAAELEIRFSPAYYIAILSAKSGQIPTLQYVRGCLEQSGDSIQTYIDRNENLVILYYDIPELPSDDSGNYILMNLEKYAEMHQLFGGVSDRFYHLKDLAVARLQAEVSIEVGNRQLGDRQMFSFRELYDDIICSYALERYGISPTIPQAMRSDTDSDKVKSLLSTIEAFIACDCNQEKTALLLGIHKNTVNYRLKQFTELTGSDIADAHKLLHIKIGLMMHRYSIDLRKRIGEEASNGSID